MSTMRFAALAAVLPLLAGGLAGGSPARAQTYYVALGTGAAQTHDGDLEVAGTAPATTTYRAGVEMSLAFGFASHDGWRIELELWGFDSDVDSVGGVPAGGEIATRSATANLFYGIDTGTRVTPFLGGGVGLARLSVSGVPTAGGVVYDEDLVVAGQAAAGIDVALSELTTLSLDYRFLATGEAKLRDSVGAGVRTDLRSSRAMVRLRFEY